jgi:hypothetical protein
MAKLNRIEWQLNIDLHHFERFEIDKLNVYVTLTLQRHLEHEIVCSPLRAK